MGKRGQCAHILFIPIGEEAALFAMSFIISMTGQQIANCIAYKNEK